MEFSLGVSSYADTSSSLSRYGSWVVAMIWGRMERRSKRARGIRLVPVIAFKDLEE